MHGASTDSPAPLQAKPHSPPAKSGGHQLCSGRGQAQCFVLTVSCDSDCSTPGPCDWKHHPRRDLTAARPEQSARQRPEQKCCRRLPAPSQQDQFSDHDHLRLIRLQELSLLTGFRWEVCTPARIAAFMASETRQRYIAALQAVDARDIAPLLAFVRR